MWFASCLLGYLGPETILPLTSVLAAIVGAIMICWNFVVRIVWRSFCFVTGRKPTSSDTDTMDEEVGVDESHV